MDVLLDLLWIPMDSGQEYSFSLGGLLAELCNLSKWLHISETVL
jgi:hypothetical protein